MASCRSHCQYDPLCTSFVHNAISQFCWLNSKIAKKIFDRPSHITSGLRNCKKASKLYRKKYFKPIEESIKLKAVFASSATSCSLMADMMEIPAFAWKKDEKSCDLAYQNPELSKLFYWTIPEILTLNYHSPLRKIFGDAGNICTRWKLIKQIYGSNQF